MSATRNRVSGQVRIISGLWRGRKLPVLHADGLRPTSDRTKETLFNWLMNDIRDAECLDAFAGAGSLGFEALSRGANKVVFVEKDKLAAKNLQQNATKLNVSPTILCSDSIQALSQHSTPFDIVFVDPPFNKGLLTPFLTALLKSKAIKNGSLVYIEYESGMSPLSYEELSLIKEKRTPQFTYALYRCSMR
ncbi:16S rRNA (guanine(966)-N(2))-methyltransferase RsmD [Alteromonas sp. 5E99-2]|uniref:16S rRNA (guanine(966)-N(2))-methyltransferase RsmD n=1 Tax=Alteromonas sp. 5E99-2 TaxID=2817683 RepID=UPI001F61A241|nr:16S rRNA (guanine(966)-N(2))-methyltransferase RsmD [Alteromonas sp. 5E99-2]